MTETQENLLLEELRPHAGKWVALLTRPDESETVVGVGMDALEAKADAASKGHAEVCLMYVGRGDTALLPKRAA